MNTMARYLVMLVASGGIIGGALGFAGTASASDTNVKPPAIVASPQVKAPPAPVAPPGWRWHHGVYHLADLQPGYRR